MTVEPRTLAAGPSTRPSPKKRTVAWRWLLSAFLFFSTPVSSAVADEMPPPQAAAGEAVTQDLESAQLRLTLGVSALEGEQQDLGPGLKYKGFTANDWALAGFLFPAGDLGASLAIQRQGFALTNGEGVVTAGGLLRVQVGPAARFQLGRVAILGRAAYERATLPAFAGSNAPVYVSATRHAAYLGAALRVGLPWGIMAEVRGGFPIALSVKDAPGEAARSNGLGLGAGLRVSLGTFRRLVYAAALDFQLDSDRLAAGTTSIVHGLRRVGLGLELGWLEPVVHKPVAPSVSPVTAVVPAPPRRGSLHVVARDAESGTPLEGAAVVVVAADGTERSTVSGKDGVVEALDLAEGEVLVRALAVGHEPTEVRVAVVAGVEAKIDLRAAKVPTLGQLTVKVMESGSGRTLRQARLFVGGTEVPLDPAGSAEIRELAPGPVSVKVTSEGFLPAEEAVVIAAGKAVALEIALTPARRKVHATLRGHIRSARGGAPIAAALAIPEAKIGIRADDQGNFRTPIPGGTYTVVLSATGFERQEKRVTLKDGEQVIFNVDLHPLAP